MMEIDQTRVLEGTPFSSAYALFFSDTDQKLVTTIGWLMSGSILFTIVWNLVGTVAYGKASTTTQDTNVAELRFWEYPISSKFTWRYGFIPTVLVPWVVIFYTPTLYLFNIPNLAALAIYYVHYFNRSVIYPSKISEKAAPNPLWFFVMVFLVTNLNTFIQAHHIANVLKPPAVSLQTFIAIAMSILGALINNHHDGILTKLRDLGKGYQIPNGSLFNWVSCPNYFGELLEWWGFAMVTGWGLPQVMFALFSTVFLTFRARFAHNWYHHKFGSKYPSGRKAIIPFIY